MKTDKLLKVVVWIVAALLGLLLVRPTLEVRANPQGKGHYMLLDLSREGIQALMVRDKAITKVLQVEEPKDLSLMAPEDVEKMYSGSEKNRMSAEAIVNYYGQQGWELVCATGTYVFLKK
jgi:hypothetical protein